MPESLRVIALISGGKDSFFSLLHCVQNGHRVVALGNLHPAPPASGPADHVPDDEIERDLNSFMYQTVGHEVIPLYEVALGLPLYRQAIVGGAVQTGTSYGFAGRAAAGDAESEEDETESLVPLLKRIMADHPTANALSTGAILSTYQRTRVESVALRMGLTPLSYLWQYPILPPGTQSSLLGDMQAVGLDARIVKVASGGLDESFLWQNVASELVVRRVEKAMKRFGTDGDGAVLGEGGEFETLVVDGPVSLFKGRIEILEEDRKVVREGGGSAWLKIVKARVVMKDTDEKVEIVCRTPDLLESRFQKMLEALKGEVTHCSSLKSRGSFTSNPAPFLHLVVPPSQQARANNTLHWTFVAKETEPNESVSAQASRAIEDIKSRLQQASLGSTFIISTVIVLHSMQAFAGINKVPPLLPPTSRTNNPQIYGALFPHPNPPSRVTISCGPLLSAGTSMTIHLLLSITPSPKRALHVQSRSYWAPANIGPYSQAIGIPVPSSSSPAPWRVSIAGQIPLIPQSMLLPPSRTPDLDLDEFKLQTVLALQHLIRIAREMHVCWFSSAVAFLPHQPSTSTSPRLPTLSQKAKILAQAWTLLHARPSDDGDDEDTENEQRDLWEEKFYAGMEIRGSSKDERALPDWEVVQSLNEEEGGIMAPPFWAVEVEELPRGSAVEWCAHVGVVGGPVKVFNLFNLFGRL